MPWLNEHCPVCAGSGDAEDKITGGMTDCPKCLGDGRAYRAEPVRPDPPFANHAPGRPCVSNCILCMQPVPSPSFIGTEEAQRRQAAAEERRRAYIAEQGVKLGGWRGNETKAI